MSREYGQEDERAEKLAEHSPPRETLQAVETPGLYDTPDPGVNEPVVEDGTAVTVEQDPQATTGEGPNELGYPAAVDVQDVADVPEYLAARRAIELQGQVPEGSRGRITMAAGVVEHTDGQRTTVVGTSEPRGYLRPGVTLDPGEIVAIGNGDAEADIIEWAEDHEARLLAIGAGRPICGNCADGIFRLGATAATPLKEAR